MSDDLIGKYVIVGIPFLDDQGDVLECFQIHGPIASIDDENGIVIEKPDASGDFSIPPDRSALRPARKGEYRLRGTSEIVDDPDFISTWTVEKTVPENIEEYKRTGFKSFLGRVDLESPHSRVNDSCEGSRS